MAVSLKTAGTWARIVATGTVTIPGTPAAGDRMFLFASWKDFAITASVANWTPIGSEFADGAVNAGNGTGSCKVMAWYRDWQTGDTDPTLTYSSGPTEGHAVIMLWQKAAGESWNTPLTVTAAMTNWTTTSQIVSASSTVVVPDGSVVMGLIGIRDDSTTMTRPTTGIDDSAAAITWNGNYVESPATHFNSTTGLDMSGDLGHRFVTTGATATLRMTGTISASETGAAKWVVQGVFTPNPQTATPGLIALTLATFAPVIHFNKIATPSIIALSISTFAPTIQVPRTATPSTSALTTNAFVPTVSTPRLTTPPTLSLTFNTFAPTVTATNNVTVTPSLLTVSLATFAPAISTPRLVTPNIANLTVTGLTPSIVAPRTVTPNTASLSLSMLAPNVDVSSGGIQPRTASLTISTFAPIVRTPRIVTPNLISLNLSGFTPQIRQSIIPPTFNLTLTGYAPDIPTGGEVTVTPSTCVLTLNLFAPIAVSFDPQNIVQISAPRTNTAKSNSQQTTTIIPAGSRIVRV